MKNCYEADYPEMLSRVVSVLPVSIGREIESLVGRVNEIRLRARAASGAVVEGMNIRLAASVTEEELREIAKRICRGSLYAYRDNILSGFLPFSHGIRVGITGVVRRDGGESAGVDPITSLAFRIPSGQCDFADNLYTGWHRGGFGSMIIVAPPGSGKTTALRALAKRASSGTEPRRVALIDEVGEMRSGDYRDCFVDILSGYPRSLGMEIALRTMSPEVIMVDELISEADVRATELAVNCGVPVVATAHGESLSDLLHRPRLEGLVRSGVFALCAAVRRIGAGYFVTVCRTDGLVKGTENELCAR